MGQRGLWLLTVLSLLLLASAIACHRASTRHNASVHSSSDDEEICLTVEQVGGKEVIDFDEAEQFLTSTLVLPAAESWNLLRVGKIWFVPLGEVANCQPFNTWIEYRYVEYTHSGNECLGHQHVDPVSVVFVKDGFPDHIVDHMRHAGWSTVGDTIIEGLFDDPQYFAAAPAGEEECRETQAQTARNVDCGLDFVCTRFHVRFYMHEYRGEPRVHPGYGGFASASPHFEYDIWDASGEECGLDSGHAVASDAEEFQINKITVTGGFNYAREEIKRTWVRGTHQVLDKQAPPETFPYTYHQHDLVDYRNWGNTDERPQCNGWVASSDGRVFYIGVKA